MEEFYCFGHEDDNFYIISAENADMAKAAVCGYGGYDPEHIKFILQLKYPVDDYVYINRTWLECSENGEYRAVKKIPRVPYDDISAGSPPKRAKKKRPRYKKPGPDDD